MYNNYFCFYLQVIHAQNFSKSIFSIFFVVFVFVVIITRTKN